MVQWKAWAHRTPDGYRDVGWKHYTELHPRSGPVVEVIATLVTDEAERTHYSWIDTGSDTPAWSLTWPSYIQFNMCFTYGWAAEVAEGKGQPIWLKVTEE